MDIMHLVDRLEDLINQGRPFPFTHNVIIDEDRILDLIDQMRVAVPEEVKKSQQLLAQRDRILAQAQEEANRTLAIAREKSDQLVARDSIAQASNSRADQIIAEARAEAENIRRDADGYVIDTLRRLELELERSMTQVRNGILSLEDQRRQVQEVPIQTPKE